MYGVRCRRGSGTDRARALRAHASAVGEHDVHRALAAAAKGERAHLQRAAQHACAAEARVRHIVVDRPTGRYLDAAGRPPVDLQYSLAGIDAPVLVFIDEHEEALLPATRVDALALVGRFAN